MADDLRAWQSSAAGHRLPAIGQSPAPGPVLESSVESRQPIADRSGPKADSRQPVADSPQPVADRRQPIADRRPPIADSSLSIRVISRGLRSFGTEDADFFLQLLPGPRGRDGLPDSVRFWKRKIEETDPDKTFSVGLLYGPSGCGKTSFVKAGLLPRLAEHVNAVYVEATPLETESRLRKGLRKRLPKLSENLSLAEMLGRLRRVGRPFQADALNISQPGKADVRKQKVVIVLDQFEQWLHGKQTEQSPELVEALRQCDGQHVQCIVMVRDDFWMAATRFMRDLEVRVLEGQNAAAVDLFDLAHARRVLAHFGRAFSQLPENPSATTKDQERFLDEAVAGLAHEGKVISVRLSLFAEMVKGKPWTPATLKQVGGAEGIGVTFLEETFSASTAPPEHRLHQKAARAVLKSLLPDQGSEIKRQMRPREELLALSGYATRPRDFEDLLRILDTELRLVTPTDPEQESGISSQRSEVRDQRSGEEQKDPDPRSLTLGPSAGYYQLTHDYLVPALRQWLTRKQRETMRGRAELRLAESAALWSARPQTRQLPSWWEWADILLFTHRRHWTPPQRTMMRKATRYNAVLTGMVLAALGLAAPTVWHKVNEGRRNREDSAKLVVRLAGLPTPEVPALIEELKPLKDYAGPSLEEMAGEATGDSKSRLHAAIALAQLGHTDQKDFLFERLLTCSADEFRVIRDTLREQQDIVPQLWAVLQNPQEQTGRCLRAAAALAAYDQKNEEWHKVGPTLADQLAKADAIMVAQWKDELLPVRRSLVKPLAQIFLKRAADQRGLLTDLLADYAKDDAEILAALLINADPRQYSIFFPELKAHGEKAAALLKQQLAQPPTAEPQSRTQAQAAVALLSLGDLEPVWGLLQQNSYLDRRSYLIDKLGPLGAPAHVILSRLETETAVSAKRAMILSLGEFTGEQLPTAERGPLVATLLQWYRDDPDPGIHSAIDWLLRHAKQGKDARKLDWGQKAGLERIDAELAGQPSGNRRWYITKSGYAMSVFHDPPPFQIGSPSDEADRDKTDENQHIQQIGRSFAIGMKSVTNREFSKVFKPTEENKYSPDPEGPATPVTWYQAALYCNWLSKCEGIRQDQWCYPEKIEEHMSLPNDYLSRSGYRLPTEAEWEYACRAGATGRRYYGSSDDLLIKYAWFQDNAYTRAWPVGQLKPNDFGLFDTLGNAWQWCQESWDKGQARSKSGSDREDSQTVELKNYRVARGAGFGNANGEVRCALRDKYYPFMVNEAISFRVARTLPDTPRSQAPPGRAWERGNCIAQALMRQLPSVRRSFAGAER